MTDVLLMLGVVATPLFFAVMLVEGERRHGYDPTYHTGSELELGERGWVQRANFFVMGGGMVAFAVGVERSLDSIGGAALLVVFGLGLVVAGVFAPDAVRGYPPGAPMDPAAEPTWTARIHHISGPVAFLAVFGACLALAGRLEDGWRLYTLLTAAVGLAMTVWTALSFQKDAPKTGLVQRGLILVYSSWIVALGIHLVASPS